MTLPLKIDAIYAFIAVGPDGQEGIVGAKAKIPGFGPEPLLLVGASLDRMKSLRSYAEEAERQSHYPIKLVKFSHKEVLETL